MTSIGGDDLQDRLIELLSVAFQIAFMLEDATTCDEINDMIGRIQETQ